MGTLQPKGKKRPIVSVAIIDDCPNTVELLIAFCEINNLPIRFCNTKPVLNYHEACALIHKEEPDIVALDLYLKDGASGGRIAEFIANYYPETKMIVISGSGQADLQAIFGQYTDLMPGKVAEDFPKCVSHILESYMSP